MLYHITFASYEIVNTSLVHDLYFNLIIIFRKCATTCLNSLAFQSCAQKSPILATFYSQVATMTI